MHGVLTTCRLVDRSRPSKLESQAHPPSVPNPSDTGRSPVHTLHPILSDPSLFVHPKTAATETVLHIAPGFIATRASSSLGVRPLRSSARPCARGRAPWCSCSTPVAAAAARRPVTASARCGGQRTQGAEGIPTGQSEASQRSLAEFGMDLKLEGQTRTLRSGLLALLLGARTLLEWHSQNQSPREGTAPHGWQAYVNLASHSKQAVAAVQCKRRQGHGGVTSKFPFGLQEVASEEVRYGTLPAPFPKTSSEGTWNPRIMTGCLILMSHRSVIRDAFQMMRHLSGIVASIDRHARVRNARVATLSSVRLIGLKRLRASTRL